MRDDFFKGIKQWEIDFNGFTGKMPIFYYDNTSMTAIYTASTKRVKKLLPDTNMRPVEMFPGRCLVAFTAFEYRKTDIDPYNEFSVAFVVTYGKTQVPGLTSLVQLMRHRFTAHVWQLPVTTEIARIGGVQVYGYPKFIADIRFERSAGSLACTLAENDTTILTLRGKALPVKRGKGYRYVTYSVSDTIPLVANVLIDPVEFAQSMKGSSAELELGRGHPISETLRDIGLGKKPVIYQYMPQTRAILFAGRNLTDN